MALNGTDRPAAAPVPINGEPEWIQPFFRPRAGADPLGQQTITTDRIIGRLLPGVLALSERARYISFYSWLLWRYVQQKRAESPEALSRYIKEREFELAVAVRLCPRSCRSSPMGAQKVTARFVNERESFSRQESVESAYGGYGLYYASPMSQMGLTARRGTLLGDDPIGIDILRPEPHALEIALAFDEAVSDTRYVREHMDGSEPIPKDVLAEYSEWACLCRLDERHEEREALRRLYFSPVGPQLATDTDRRREGFALFLDLASSDAWNEYNDDQFRMSIWRAFRTDGDGGEARASALSAWAALAAANYLHDGVTLMWLDGCRRLRAEAPEDGYSRAELLEKVAGQADGHIDTLLGEIIVSRDEPTASLLAQLEARLPPDDDLPAMWRAATQARSTAGGMSLVLAVLTRLPADSGDAAWSSIASIDGGWQDGLARLARKLAVHLESGPTTGTTAAFLMNQLVLRPHEANAASKLPDFTFLFRWELGRLQFFHHFKPEFTRPGNIRAWTLAQLSRDLGYCELFPTRLTADGEQFVREVLS
jgi:hypothetical protein